MQKRRRDGLYASPKGGHPLTGKLLCPDCGRRFRRLIINDIAYWECTYHVSGKTHCRGIRYNEDAVYAAFILLLHKMTANREYILTPLTSQLTRAQQRHSGVHNKIYEVDRQIAALNEQNISIANNHAKGRIDMTEFAAMTGTVNQKVGALRAQRRKLLAENENDALLDELAELDDILAGAAPGANFDPEIFGQAVESIAAVSNTEVRFILKGGLDLPEGVRRVERRTNA